MILPLMVGDSPSLGKPKARKMQSPEGCDYCGPKIRAQGLGVSLSGTVFAQHTQSPVLNPQSSNKNPTLEQIRKNVYSKP